jgi:hypothetical protein
MRETLTVRGVVRQGVLIRFVLGAAACAVTASVYFPAIDYPFVLDDRTTVLLNPSLVALSDWRGILTYDRWHPLVNVSFAIDQAFSGISPIGFRVTNGVLHLAVVAFVFALASRRPGVRPGSGPAPTGVRRRSAASAAARLRRARDQGQTTFDVSSEPTQAIGRAWAGFAAAATFGVNPLAARSVAYVSARADLLFAAVILLACMLAWGAARARSVIRMALAAAVAAMALMATPWGAAAIHGPRRLYLTTALVLLCAARLASPIFARSRATRVASALAVGALALLAQLTLARWADPVALWRAAVERTPAAWDAHLGYADALREASRCQEAVAEYKVALRLHPGQEDARRALARCR